MPKPPSHPRYQAVARSEPYPSSANRSGGGNNHGGGHGHSGRGSTGRMYHPAGSVSTAGVTSGVPPAHQQSAAPPNFGYGPNTGIGAGSGPGASGIMNPQYGSEFPATTTTSTPRTIPRNFGQQSSPSSSSTYGQSFDSSLQGSIQHNSSPSSAPNFQLTGYQHQSHPLQQPPQHQSLQHHQHQQQHQSPTIANQNAAHPHPTQFGPQSHQPQAQPQQQHQPPSQSHHQPPQAAHPNQTPIPNPPTHNPRPNSPNHNPTTTWTPQEDTTLLSSRASNTPWSELQRLHFPSKTANACRKRHERLIEKRQAEEQVDEDRLSRIAGEYVRMREELWQGLAERMGMEVREVEERCLGWGLGGLRVAGRRGGRRRGEGRGHGGMGRRHGGMGMVVAGGSGMGTGTGMGLGGAAGLIGSGPVSTAMPMILGQGQGLSQAQGDGGEGKNYTHSPVQMAAAGTGQSPTGLGPGTGMVGPGPGAGHGFGMGMLPPQTAPPLTTLIPIPSTTGRHGFTSALPTSSAAPGMGTGIPAPPPPLPLLQQQQPRVAFGGYLNGRSSSRRLTNPVPLSSAPPSAPVSVNPPGPGAYQQGQGQQWTPQGGPNLVSVVGGGTGSFAQNQPAPLTGQTRHEQTWHNNAYPPSSFG